MERKKLLATMVLVGLIGMVVFATIYWSGKLSVEVTVKDVATGELAFTELSFEVEECSWYSHLLQEEFTAWTYKENITVWVEMINWSIYPLDVFEWIEARLIVRQAPEGSGLEEGEVFLELNETNSWSAYRNLTIAGEYVFDFELCLHAGQVSEDTVVTWDVWFYLCTGLQEGDPVILWAGCIKVVS